MAADLKGLVEIVAQGAPDAPDAVEVRETERRGGTVFELVDPAIWPRDRASGAYAAALRLLLQSAGEASGKRVTARHRD